MSSDTAPTPDPRIPATELRWRCDPSELPFETTAEVDPSTAVIGQDEAVDALAFGLRMDGPGQHIFVRGLSGTGRMTMIGRLVEAERPSCPLVQDRCYVHNFDRADRPRLISLPRGQGGAFVRQVEALIGFIGSDLADVLSSESLRMRRAAMQTAAETELKAASDPFDEQLRENNLTMVTVARGQLQLPMILPLREGKPVAPNELAKLVAEGQVSEEQAQQWRDQAAAFESELEALGLRLQEIQARHRDAIRDMVEGELREMVAAETAGIRQAFGQPEVDRFLAGVEVDAVAHLLRGAEDDSFTVQYHVNWLGDADEARSECPIVAERVPTVRNLLGIVERRMPGDTSGEADHMLVRAGALLRADGGYLILDAYDLISEPGAWKVLVRTLRTGLLEIVPDELQGPWAGPAVQPEPIPINVKVVLVGSPALHHMLDRSDPDFPELFKVLVDVDPLMPNDTEAVARYAGVLSRISAEEGLLPFDRSAVAALAEHGARIAARQDRLTTRFGRLADIAREAAFLARESDRDTVDASAVSTAVRRGRRRADRPARRFREMIADGIIGIRTRGSCVGQINGLAVIDVGPLTYGFPNRITATIGPGSAGTINIEREAQLSGAIHTKGFYILGGLLRHLLRIDHPLAFSASIAFEQSYGGIDGDSASGAESCSLISALTGVPLRQDLAMTGAIDQFGAVQAVGAVTEKIEGFYDTCMDSGLTGTQGVIIPATNCRDLMLRHDVVEACEAGRFGVYAVARIHDALALLTGQPAGEADVIGGYPEGTLLASAVSRARTFWEMAVARRATEM